MIFSVDRMQPDPAKIDALKFITAPTNRNDHISFLCMMQLNLDFILNFTQKAEPLRKLTHQNTHFRWKRIHQKCFEILILDFKNDTLLRYFPVRNKIFEITNTHITSLRAKLTQGDHLESERPVIIVRNFKSRK